MASPWGYHINLFWYTMCKLISEETEKEKAQNAFILVMESEG